MTSLAEEASHGVHWEEGAKLRGRGDLQGPQQGKACPLGPRSWGLSFGKGKTGTCFPGGGPTDSVIAGAGLSPFPPKQKGMDALET